MLNQFAVEIPTLPVDQCLSQLVRDPGGMLSRSFRRPSRRDGPPSIWDTHGISGNVFVNPTASSSAPYPQELNPWSSHIPEPIHHFQPKQFVKTFGICLCFSHEGCPSHFVRLIVFCFPARLLFVENVCERSSRRQANPFINAVCVPLFGCSYVLRSSVRFHLGSCRL